MEPEERNPYHWTGEDLDVRIARTVLLKEVRKELLSGGGSGYLLGGTGMGKSVFLDDLREDLSIPGVQPILFKSAPMGGTVEALHRDLVDKLVDTCRNGSEDLKRTLQDLRAYPDLRKVVEAYLDGPSGAQVLVLLYDELDDYADPSGHGKQWIKSLESLRKEKSRQLKLFAAGGLRLFSVGDSLASPFLSRARRFLMLPFDSDQVHELAARLLEKSGEALPVDALEQVLMHSGGNAQLVQYGLHKLWDGERDIVGIYEKFKREDGGFLRRIRRTVADDRVSKLPSLFWSAILRGGGELTQSKANDIFTEDENDLSMEVEDVIALLQSAGLIRLESPIRADPIRVSVIPSILNFEPRVVTRKKRRTTLRAQLVDDLRAILGLLHSCTLDFLPGGKPATEDTFSALIATNLQSRGWISAEREAILGAGHPDIKAIHDHFPGQTAVIEVKIWPRNNYQGIHQQVASYWSDGVTAGAAVMLDVRLDVTQWKSEYELDCLDGKAQGAWQPPRSPLHGHVVAISSLPNGVTIEVDHFLLHLQRAPTAKPR